MRRSGPGRPFAQKLPPSRRRGAVVMGSSAESVPQLKVDRGVEAAAGGGQWHAHARQATTRGSLQEDR
jgi:hypothetical protein